MCVCEHRVAAFYNSFDGKTGQIMTAFLGTVGCCILGQSRADVRPCFFFHWLFYRGLLVKVIATAIASKNHPKFQNWGLSLGLMFFFPRKCHSWFKPARLLIKGLHWSVSRIISLECFRLWMPRVLKHGVVLVMVGVTVSPPAKTWRRKRYFAKIGNVETYLKWTFLSVENAITRSCSLAKKGKCKALPVCQANFEILKVWIAFLYQVPQVLTHAVWRTEGNYEFVPTRGTHATMQLDLGALR